MVLRVQFSSKWCAHVLRKVRTVIRDILVMLYHERERKIRINSNFIHRMHLLAEFDVIIYPFEAVLPMPKLNQQRVRNQETRVHTKATISCKLTF